MARIEAALKRLAEDDRLYAGEGAGELADLIEAELNWMEMPELRRDELQERLQTPQQRSRSVALLEEGTVSDLNCLNSPYNNNFEVDGFYADTPGPLHPGPGLSVERGRRRLRHRGRKGRRGNQLHRWSDAEHDDHGQPAPGDKVNPSSNLASGSWVGWGKGSVIACAGEKSQVFPTAKGPPVAENLDLAVPGGGDRLLQRQSDLRRQKPAPATPG